MNLNQITIPVLDVEKAIEFYQILGLKLIVFTHKDYARFECPNGDSTLSLHRVDELTKGPGIMVYFENEHLDEQVKILQSKGIKFDTLPTNQTWLWREASLHDLDGNKIILYHAGENRKNPPWKYYASTDLN